MEGRIAVAVRVIPGSKVDRVAGARDGRLLVRVSAPPEDGRANAAARAVLAAALGLGRREVRIEAGERSRDKTVSLPGGARAALDTLMK